MGLLDTDAPRPMPVQGWSKKKKFVMGLLASGIVATIGGVGTLGIQKYFFDEPNLTDLQKQEIRVMVQETSPVFNDIVETEKKFGKLMLDYNQLQIKAQETQAQLAQKEIEFKQLNDRRITDLLTMGIRLYDLRLKVSNNIFEKMSSKDSVKSIELELSAINSNLDNAQKEGMIDTSNATIADLLTRFMHAKQASLKKK